MTQPEIQLIHNPSSQSICARLFGLTFTERLSPLERVPGIALIGERGEKEFFLVCSSLMCKPYIGTISRPASSSSDAENLHFRCYFSGGQILFKSLPPTDPSFRSLEYLLQLAEKADQNYKI